MKEDFLHFMWQYQLFTNLPMYTNTGSEVRVLHPGYHNHNSGPDFREGKIQIGAFEWFGPVEIHVRSSDWLKHKHHTDPAFGHVILHVVYENDREIFLHQPGDLPVLELKPYLQPEYRERYLQLIENARTMPCSSRLTEISELLWTNWMDRLLVQRLERRCAELDARLIRARNDWEEVAWQVIVTAFGMKVNREAFDHLGKILPRLLVQQVGSDPFRMEALLFGMSGILPQYSDSKYVQGLISEFEFLRHKHQLSPMASKLWHRLRMRPGGLPEVRIAQLASVASKGTDFLNRILDCTDTKSLKQVFSALPSEYWNTHYGFKEDSKCKPKPLGQTALDHIIINACVPLVYTYGKARGYEGYCSLALQWLDQVKSEQNQITAMWKKMGRISRNAGDSQALIELKSHFCDHKKCLSCMVGVKLLKQN
ncbi:MAG: DUF2851 family protein [Flavobacteriales bacterium]|nr:DUF2851 family protein [Flavobacteriales bacterium]